MNSRRILVAALWSLVLLAGSDAFAPPGRRQPPLAPLNALPITLDGIISRPSFPKLYGDWFGDGGLASSARASVASALRDGVTAMEVRVPALPNLDEALVRAGTPLNERFQKETAASLGMTTQGGKDLDGKSTQATTRDGKYMLIKRSPLGYANLYWAKRLLPAFGLGTTVWVVQASQCRSRDPSLFGRPPSGALGDRIGACRAVGTPA